MGGHIWAQSVGVVVGVMSVSAPASVAQTVADTAPVIFLGTVSASGTGGFATLRPDCKTHVADTLSKLGYVVDQGGGATELDAHHPTLPVGVSVQCGYMGKLAITTPAGAAERWRPEHLRVQNALRSVFGWGSPTPLRRASTGPAVTGPSAPPAALAMQTSDLRPDSSICNEAAQSVLRASGYAVVDGQSSLWRIRGTKGGEAVLFDCSSGPGQGQGIGAVHAGGPGRGHSRAEVDRLLASLVAATTELARVRDAEAGVAAAAANQRACARAPSDPPVPWTMAHLQGLPLRVVFPFTPCRVETTTSDGRLTSLTLDHDRDSYVASISEPAAGGANGRALLDQALERLRGAQEMSVESENIYDHQGSPAAMVWAARTVAGERQAGVVRLVAYQGRIYTQAFWYDPSADVEARLKRFSDSLALLRTP